MRLLSLTTCVFIGLLAAASSVLADPVITSVSPSNGPTAGGLLVTISGSGFAAPVSATLNGAVLNISSSSATRIVATVPAGNPGPANVVVTSGGVPSAPLVFSYDAPQITGITPSSGPSIGGFLITVTGSNFGTSSAIRYTTMGLDAASEASYLGHGAYTVTCPPRSAGASVPLSVTINGLESNSVTFTYTSPAIVSVTPNTSPTPGGATLTITGSNFGATQGTVTVGGRTSSVLQWTNTSIRSQCPEGDPGVQPIVVTLPNTQTAEATLAYDAPQISAGNPLSGSATGGTVITLTGSNFGTFTATRQSWFGTTPGPTPAYQGHTRLSVGTPPGARGSTVSLRIEINGVLTNAIPFTYGGAPTIVEVTPAANLPTAGGTRLTIYGHDFGNTAGSVVIGTRPASQVVWTESQILCTLPEGNPGERYLIVHPYNDDDVLSVISYAAPQINLLSPAAGPAAGGTLVTIHGSNFGTSSAVRTTLFGGVVATQQAYLGHDAFVVVAPSNPAGSIVDVQVIDSGVASNLGTYIYQNPLDVPAPGAAPARFAVHANRPNPFMNSTRLQLDLAAEADYAFAVYGVDGRLVHREQGHSGAGVVTLRWDGRDAGGNRSPAGLYFYRVQVPGRLDVRRRMLLSR